MRFKLDIRQCALLVIDMQEYFHSMAVNIIPNIKNLISAFRISNLPVIYTQHSHKNPAIDGGMLGEWWGDLIIKGTRKEEQVILI